MSSFVSKQASFSVGAIGGAGVLLTSWVKNVTVSTGTEPQDATSMSATAVLPTRISLAGLKTWSMEVEFLQDYAAAGPDVTLYAYIGTLCHVAFQPVWVSNNTATDTDPIYHGAAVLESYTPMSGNVGEMSTCKATFKSAGPLTRAVATKTMVDTTS
jgi:hypothetical protein